MKKKIMAHMLVVAMVAAVLSGCGESDQPGNESAVTEATGEEMEAENGSAQTEGMTEAETESGEASKEGNWFADQGLTVTPKGDFISVYSLYGKTNSNEETETFLEAKELSSNIEIIDLELTDGYDYKELFFSLTHDRLDGVREEYKDSPYNIFLSKPVVFCFDRYTGTALSVMPLNNMDDQNAVNQFEEEIREKGLKGEAAYTITKSAMGQAEKIILYCPADYDGAVLAVQYCYEEDAQAVSEFEDAVLQADRTIGKGPDITSLLREDCIFFTLTDN